jgi:glycine/D-amino acid oxidase-like deaminating enzyme
MGFSKDGKPIIGPINSDPTLWCAVGFTGYGLGMCWSVGEAVAEVLNDESSLLTEQLAIFSPNRFKTS